MPDKLADIGAPLFCPDDGGPLRYGNDHLLCSACGRRFPILGGEIVDLLPTEPTEIRAGATSDEYRQGYLKEFANRLRLDEHARGWGAVEAVPPYWLARKARQLRQALPLILDSACPSDLVLCDLAAGAGFYSLEYARHFQYVLHCDLSAAAISYAYFRARKSGIRNMVFLRVDYLRPPFRHSLERVLCLDALIRGQAHETMLLTAIKESLAPSGVALVDFHNWWHNPLRRIGLLTDNFRANRSYTRRETEALLRAAGVSRYDYAAFHQEFDRTTKYGPLLAGLVPPTRFMYRLRGL